MGYVRILAIATSIEICFASALLALLGLGGVFNSWLDVINAFTPLTGLLGAAGAVVAGIVLPRGRFRVVCIGLGLSGAVFATAMVGPDLIEPWLQPKAKAGVAYSIVVANVFSDNVSPFSAARSLIQRGADAVIVEEADGNITKARTILASRYAYSTTCAEGGVQIWLRTPILAQGCNLPTPAGSVVSWGQGFTWVSTRGPDGRPITLAGLHLGRPYPPMKQAVERQALRARLQGLAKDDTLVAGDMNTTPWSFAMQRLEAALAPLTRRTHGLPTYPAFIKVTQTSWNAPLLPIDHIFAGRRWSTVALTRFRVPNSDHFAIDARLKLTP